MFAKLLLLFTLIPLIEFWLLYEISQVSSFEATVLLVIVTGVIGAGLAKHEGLRVYRQMHEELAEGKMPGDRLIDALMILVAGALLVTPGVLTDFTGFCLLIPPIRAIIRRKLKARFSAKMTIVGNFQNPFQSQSPFDTQSPFGTQQNDDVIDVESHVVEDEDPQ